MPAPIVAVTGPPGAGKSTVTDLLVHRWSPSALVEGDRFFGFLREGFVAPWLPESHAQNGHVVGAAAAAAGRFAQGGITVVYDGMIGPWFVGPFLAATGLDALHYVVLLPDEAVCLERVRTRVGHGFTDQDAARHLYSEFATADLPERHVLRPAADDPAAVVVDRIAALVAFGDAMTSRP